MNGEAIFGTRPWTRADGVTGDGTPVRFTASRDGARVYAAVMGALPASEVTLVGVDAPRGVRLLGSGALQSSTNGADVRIELPAMPPAQPVHVFELSQ